MISYDSVLEFFERVENELPSLDIAILNASIIDGVFNKFSTGHEETMQVNYYSTMLLTILLLPILKKRSAVGIPGRLTIATTMLSLIAKFANKDQVPLLPSFDKEELYDRMHIYPTSKLPGQIFLSKLADLVSADDVIVNMLEPGFTKGTELQRKESHGCLLMNWDIIPFVGLMYTEQGREIMDRLWQETMEEFQFVDASGILKSL